jgi:hypothetical protein
MTENVYQLQFSAKEIDELLQKIKDMSPGSDSEGYSIWLTDSQYPPILTNELVLILGDAEVKPKTGDVLIKSATFTVHRLVEMWN